MRTLRLLLSAGAMLSLAAGSAYASRIMDQQGNPATPTGTGLLTTLSGFQEMGSPYTGAQGLEPEPAAPFSVPAPGTINMRVNSFVNEFPMAVWWTGQNGAGTPAGNAGNKNQGYGIYGWIRIDLGIDGQTKTGIKYGAYTQIRENNTTAITGGPATAISGFGQNASADSSDNTLYVRHAVVYIGTDQLGFIRVGTGIAAQTLYETGLSDNFDIGGWISFGGTSVPGNMAPVWPWADEGLEYMAARIGYYSPVIAGFDFGIAFAPNNSTPFDGSGCSLGYGGNFCATQSSSTSPSDYGGGRYRNELGMALRYHNAFGPIGVNVSGIWTVSGKVNDAAAAVQPYKGLDIGDIGASVTVNHAWNISGNVMWGAFNGNWQLQPVGGSSAVAWVVGTKYTIMPIPLTIGTYYFNYKYNGLATARPAGMGERTSQGIDFGAVYGLGPGVVLLAEYAWGQNSQTGFDFLTGTAGPSGNTVNAQVATVGMSVRF
jgi:hypothetical protein